VSMEVMSELSKYVCCLDAGQEKLFSTKIDIGWPSRAFPVTPPGIRVRTTAVRLVKQLVDLPTLRDPACQNKY